MQTDKLKRMFDADSKLLLDSLTRLVGQILAGASGHDKIDRAFRDAHSIKSEAGFLELATISDAAHRLEDTLNTLRDGSGDQSDHARSLQSGLETLTREISEYQESRSAEVDSQQNRVAGNPGRARLGAAEIGMLREARGRNETLYRVVVQLTCDTRFMYPRGFLVVNNLEMECAVISVSPDLEGLGNDGVDRLTILLTTARDEQLLRRLLNVDEVTVIELTDLAYGEIETDVVEESDEIPSVTMLHVPPERQEEVQILADEVSHLASRMSTVVGDTNGTASDGAVSGGGAVPGMPNADPQELARSLAAYARLLKSEVDRVSRIQLLDVVRELKSRAIAHAEAGGKRIRFAVSGSGAAVYTTVADALTDSIMHLVRNSIDHGILEPSRRLALGKPGIGTVKVSVERLGDSTRIRVTDDGEGVDEATVRAGDDNRSLLDVLASPGFSVRSEADHSSGRGVGLSTAVHTVRELLSGGIELRTVSGKGTIVSISIPTASRLVGVIVVDSPDGAAAIPSSMVIEYQELNLRRFKRDSFGGKYYDFQGQTLPMLTLFGQIPKDEILHDASVGIVVACGARKAVLVGTRIIATESVVRDDIRRRRVFSRTLDREVPFVFPPSFLTRQ